MIKQKRTGKKGKYGKYKGMSNIKQKGKVEAWIKRKQEQARQAQSRRDKERKRLAS